MKNAGPLVAAFVVTLLLSCVTGCGSSSSAPPAGSFTFMYAGNQTSPASMAVFSSSSASVVPLSGSPFSTGGSSPVTLVIASKKFLYAGVSTASGSGGGILLMPIGTDGKPGTPQVFAAGKDYEGIAVTPNGKFLYAADAVGSQLAAFSIDQSTGALTAITLQPTPTLALNPNPTNVRIDPKGQFVFVMSCDCSSSHIPSQGAVQVFAINADGTLAAVPGSPHTPAGAANPIDAAVSPDGTLLFVISDDSVFAETIAADGALSDAGHFDMPVTGSMAANIAVTPDGNFVYTADRGLGEVSGFSVGTIITAFSISNNVATFTARNHFAGGESITLSGLTTGNYLNGQTLTVLSSPPAVLSSTQFQVSFTHADVSLTTDFGVAKEPTVDLVSLPNAAVGGATTSLAIPSAGGVVYAVNHDNGKIVVFTIAKDGFLTPSAAVNTGGVHPFGLVLDQ